MGSVCQARPRIRAGPAPGPAGGQAWLRVQRQVWRGWAGSAGPPLGSPARRPSEPKKSVRASQMAGRGTPADGVEAETPLHLPLVHDGVGVAMRNAVLVGKPVGALFTAQEGRTRFNTSEPLSKVTTRDAGYAGDQIFVRLQGASQRQLAPPGVVKPLGVSLHQ